MKKRLQHKKHRNKGFSVIELAVAISVAATVAVGYLVWAKPENQSNAEKIAITNQRMQAIEEAISYFFVDEGRLPCPADPLSRADGTKASGAGNTDFGRESVVLAINGITCPREIGTLPVISIGLNESYAYDAWGRLFTYHISDALCGDDSDDNDANEANSCTAKDFASGTADLSVQDENSNSISTAAAYIIVSHGPDGIGGYLPSGERQGTPSQISANENSNGDTKYKLTLANAANTDLIGFKTKSQIDTTVLDPIGTVVSSAACNENAATLASFNNTDTSEATALNDATNGLNSFKLNTANISKNNGSELIISTLWGIQSLCIDYFSNVADATVGWNGPACPGGGTFDTSSNTCFCASGTWDGDCSL